MDDDPDAHFFLARALRQAGVRHPVESLYGGREAIEYFRQCVAGTKTWPFVTFLDVKMPLEDGFTVLGWLREHDLLGKTVVAMLSSSEMPKDVSRAFTLGAHTYLSKSPSAETLLKLVEGTLRLAQKKTLAGEL